MAGWSWRDYIVLCNHQACRLKLTGRRSTNDVVKGAVIDHANILCCIDELVVGFIHTFSKPFTGTGPLTCFVGAAAKDLKSKFM